jgi:hypothetical protein
MLQSNLPEWRSRLCRALPREKQRPPKAGGPAIGSYPNLVNLHFGHVLPCTEEQFRSSATCATPPELMGFEPVSEVSNFEPFLEVSQREKNKLVAVAPFRAHNQTSTARFVAFICDEVALPPPPSSNGK